MIIMNGLGREWKQGRGNGISFGSWYDMTLLENDFFFLNRIE